MTGDLAIPAWTQPCPSGVLQQTFPVTREMAGEEGHMGPGDLARCMEAITQAQLEAHGASREALRREGKIWVIAWSRVELARLPAPGETVTLRLWPGKRKTAMYVRRYALYGAGGEGLASAASLFLLMDSASRAMAEPPSRWGEEEQVQLPGEPPLPPLRTPFPPALPQRRVRVVRPEEIDGNGHLNNACYLDWAQALTRGTAYEGRTPGELWIQYIKELMVGQEAVLEYGWEGDTLFLRGRAEDTDAFLLTVRY